jgi:hypothetical protein
MVTSSQTRPKLDVVFSYSVSGTSHRFSQLQSRSRKVADHVYPTELASQVFFSYYEWHSLVDAAETIGLRFWHDLLAAFTRLGHAGIWDLTHFVLLNWLSRDGQIDWSHAVVDSCSVRAGFGRRCRAFVAHLRLRRKASQRR